MQSAVAVVASDDPGVLRDAAQLSHADSPSDTDAAESQTMRLSTFIKSAVGLGLAQFGYSASGAIALNTSASPSESSLNVTGAVGAYAKGQLATRCVAPIISSAPALDRILAPFCAEGLCGLACARLRSFPLYSRLSLRAGGRPSARARTAARWMPRWWPLPTPRPTRATRSSFSRYCAQLMQVFVTSDSMTSTAQ